MSWARNRQAKNHRARNHRAIGQEKADGKLELNKLILYLAKQKKTLQQELFQCSYRFYLDVLSAHCVVCSANQNVRGGIFGQIPLQIFHKL